MKFISLELHGFKRIMLSGINTFKINPTQDIQLILGTNGSGKSSILDELTPLPSNTNDFIKDGYSIKTISHNGFLYVLKSTFSPGQKHSFIKDGEELNLGGTVSVQKELVRQEFLITTDIHELLIGRDRFTEMSPAARRQWMTNLSNTSYEYAISVYNKLREKHRDISGALKLSKNRLVTETSKLISEEEQQKLKNDVEQTHEYIQHLLEYRKPVEENIETLTRNAKELEKVILDKTTAIIAKYISLQELDDSFSFTRICSTITTLMGEENFIKHVLNENYERFEQVKQSIILLEKTGSQGTEDIRKKIDSVFREQTGLLTKKLVFQKVHQAPLEALRAIETIGEALGSIFLQIPSNSDKKFSRLKLTEYSDELFRLKEEKNKLQNTLTSLNGKKLHQEAHKHAEESECPKCKHKWFKGFDELIYSSICQDIELMSLQITNIDKQIKEKESLIEEIHSYMNLYKQYTSFVTNWPTLENFWNYITETGFLLSNPGKLISDLELYKSSLYLDKSFHELETEITRLKELMAISQQVSNLDIEKLTKERDEIEAKIYSLNLKLADVVKNIKKFNLFKKTYEDVTVLEKELETLQNNFETSRNVSIETLRRTYLNNAIRIIQSSLIRKEEQLNELRSQHAVIKELKDSITRMEEDEICLKSLVKEMSPSEGLIAEGLFGFIKMFVTQMNNFIKRIWTYKLEIQPCELSSDGKVDLDYKFPMRVEGMSTDVPDISRGSTGMKEIVNLAYKITAMKYLGLSDSPLFLDEFGAAMDSIHRANSIEMMKHIADEQPFTQLFIVNHYDSIYGALTNAEICVLCSSNIDIPRNAVYNRHVEIS